MACYEDKVRRSIGTRVSVHDTSDFGTEDEPFQLVCWGPSKGNAHGGVLNVNTLTQAREWAAHPEEWCPYCSGQETD